MTKEEFKELYESFDYKKTKHYSPFKNNIEINDSLNKWRNLKNNVSFNKWIDTTSKDNTFGEFSHYLAYDKHFGWAVLRAANQAMIWKEKSGNYYDGYIESKNKEDKKVNKEKAEKSFNENLLNLLNDAIDAKNFDSIYRINDSVEFKNFIAKNLIIKIIALNSLLCWQNGGDNSFDGYKKIQNQFMWIYTPDKIQKLCSFLDIPLIDNDKEKSIFQLNHEVYDRAKLWAGLIDSSEADIELIPDNEQKESYVKLYCYLWSLVDDKQSEIDEKNLEDMNDEIGSVDFKEEINEPTQANCRCGLSLNTILQGPPGTGKTYNTSKYAVAICNDMTISEVENEEQKDPTYIKNEFKRLSNDGRIGFVTFHQSYGYEDFIEGIKPRLDLDESENLDEAKDINYEIVNGSFKEFCNNARTKGLSINGENSLNSIEINSSVWCIFAKDEKNDIAKYCLDNNEIRISFKDIKDDEIEEDSDSRAKKQILSFREKIKIGDLVILCSERKRLGNNSGIGIVTGDYEFDSSNSDFPRKRSIKWLKRFSNNESLDIIKLNSGKWLPMKTVTELSRIQSSDLLNVIGNESNKEITKKRENCVFIIDEINRGNISKIFGELITLIEDNKREHEKDELSAILPYSQKSFSVPNNVYILGTMNTADRSISLMDTALQRRFSKIEMMPDPSLLNETVVEVKNAEGYECKLNIGKMIETINKRIEYLYDREHTIGHAYFLPLRDNPDIKLLSKIFKTKIIPLLQEYFYDDYEKIRLVLGDNQKSHDFFIESIDSDVEKLFGNNEGSVSSKKSIFEINKELFNKIEFYEYLGLAKIQK